MIFVIVILDCFVMIFLFVPSVFLDIVLLLVLILLIFTLDDVLLVITSEMDEGLLVVLFFRIVIWRVRGLLTHELGVGPGAGNTVGAEDGVEVPDNFSLQVDGALDSALVDALDRLFDTADSTDIVAKERHPCYLDIPERDSHLVDEVEVHKVGISVGNLGPTRDCKWDLFANKREIRTFWNIYLVCSNCHRIVEVGVHQVVLLGIRLRLLHKGTGVFDQDDLAATKTDVRCVGSVVNFHNRTKRHIDLYETEL